MPVAGKVSTGTGPINGETATAALANGAQEQVNIMI